MSDQKINQENSLEYRLKKEIKSSDAWAWRYKALSWFLPAFLAVLGIFVAADAELPKPWNLILGAVSAGLATLQKGIEPAKRGEWQTSRKRALEIIQIQVERPSDDPTPLTNTQIKCLIVLTKQDPAKVLEDLAILTKVDLPTNQD